MSSPMPDALSSLADAHSSGARKDSILTSLNESGGSYRKAYNKGQAPATTKFRAVLDMLGFKRPSKAPANAMSSMLEAAARGNTKGFVIGGKDVGIMAHELGHLKHFGKPGGLERHGAMPMKSIGIGSLAGTLNTMLNKDEDSSLAISSAASAAGIPLVHREMAASNAGNKILKNLGSNRSLYKRLGAYKGLPTYALGALAPTLMHYAKKGLGGFDE